MLLKCSQCTFLRKFNLNITRTLTVSTNNFNGASSNPLKMKNAAKDSKTQTIPEKETLRTILKLQHVDNNLPKGFKTVYRFSFIQYIALVNRIKVYQSIFSVMAILGSAALESAGVASEGTLLASITLAISSNLFFYSLGYMTNGFVGFVYFNEEAAKVRIAYVDFWGRRRDIEVPVKDIMPSYETARYYTLIPSLHHIHRYSTNDKLKIVLENSKFIQWDKEALTKIF